LDGWPGDFSYTQHAARNSRYTAHELNPP
jgi:hypothetical protein